MTLIHPAKDVKWVLYVIDLGGDIRKNPKLSGTTHNVFGIQTGVAISFMVKRQAGNNTPCKIFYTRRSEFDIADSKLSFLAETEFSQIDFEHITPDKNCNWINQADNDFENLLPLVDKDVKSEKTEQAVFKLFSRGIATQRDEWAYDLSKENLANKMNFFVQIYQNEFNKQKQQEFSQEIKWDEDLRSYFKRGIKKNLMSKVLNQVFIDLFTKSIYTLTSTLMEEHINGLILLTNTI